MERSESIAQLAEALSKAQSKFPLVKRDSENPFFRSRYADLGSIIEAIQPAMSANGLSVTQLPSTDIEQQCVVINTILMHSSGEFMGSEFRIPVPDWKAQGLGSATTYARRYSLQAVLNIASDSDDDGNAASQGNGRNLPPKQLDGGASKMRPPLDPKATEVKQIKEALVNTCKLLNSAGDKPTWGAKRLDEFAIKEYGAKADDLELEPLRELLKKLSNKHDAVKKSRFDVGDPTEVERQAMIAKIKSKHPAVAIDAELKAVHAGAALESLSLDQLVELNDSIVPF